MAGRIESVPIPTDGSSESLAGAESGIELASAAGAAVHVLSVVDVSDEETVRSALEHEGHEPVRKRRLAPVRGRRVDPKRHSSARPNPPNGVPDPWESPEPLPRSRC